MRPSPGPGATPVRVLPAAILLLAAATTGNALATDAAAEAALPAESPTQLGRPVAPSEQGAGTDCPVVGEIEIHVADIFDPDLPGEDRRLFRLANRLHRNTRDSVVRQQLLFKEGDCYDAAVVEESARQLRGDRYFRDAEISPAVEDRNRVDLAVATRDVWTLNAGFAVGRRGGVNSTRFQVQDTNLLGTGKALTLRQASNVDRTSSEILYNDANILGGRWQLDAALAENSDGSYLGLEVGRPFFSLDSHWAVNWRASSEDRVDSLYDLGAITDQFRHQADQLEVSGGWSRGRGGPRIRRWSAGFTYRRDRFGLAADSSEIASVPGDRTLAYPWIAFESLEDDFLKARNQDRMERVEDLEVGRRSLVRLGFSPAALSGIRDEAVFEARLGLGVHPAAHQTLLVSSDLSGRWGQSGGPDNLRLGAGVRYYRRNFGDHLFFATLQGVLARNRDPEAQILLGGDNGLRGYPLRYQQGDRSVLLTLEQRLFSNLHPWKLFRVGGAAFLDAGQVWRQDASGGTSNLGLLKDIGLGLRLGSSRSSRGSMVHLDVAFPLDGDGSIRSLQWLITSKETF